MHVAVSGAGIAGLTLAHCLHRNGIECTVLEKSPGPRSEGYMIDFFDSGYDAAERLGMLPDLEKIHYPIDTLTFLDASGHEKYSVSYPDLRKLFNNRHFNFLRGDLEHALYEKVRGQVDVRFGTTVRSVEQTDAAVNLELSDGSRLSADLLAGADGVHSQVRALCFGEESRYERYLRCNTAAFILSDPPPSIANTNRFYMLTMEDRQVSIYPIRGGKVATFFVHTADSLPPRGAEAEELRSRYGDMNWVVPDLLRHVDPSALYFDAVSQIVMPRWSEGRVVLIGDAAHCVSLLAGQGASLAMAGAYVLAEELGKNRADPKAALASYERRMRPTVEKKQASGRSMAKWFLPENSIRLAFRDFITRYSANPLIRPLMRRALAPSSVFNQGGARS
jgi:2-polyprenyl-6-methoxyphenol hydroxylase-like FAD-dependent oxidoreductase